jgi:peptidoglycan/xylan/chitin deacetylase (PgdA/CDA1 family)
MYCAADLDTTAAIDLDSIQRGLARAAARGEQIHLYAHNIGVTVGTEKLEQVLDAIDAQGLPYVTYRDLAAGVDPGAAVVLSFDDQWIDSWTAARPAFLAHGVRATFYITRYYQFTPEGRAELHQLAADGHDVEAHTVNHLRAPDYVADHGIRRWMNDEAMPSIDALTADGFDPPVAFAYPFGERTDETDRAMLDHVAVLRSVAFDYSAPIADPCPL